jgi:hypothetical protein
VDRATSDRGGGTVVGFAEEDGGGCELVGLGCCAALISSLSGNYLEMECQAGGDL